MKNTRNNLHTMTICSLFAAMMSVLSPIVIPIGAVPFSLGMFSVMILSVILKPKHAFVAVMLYILIGICGLPVFASFTGGLGVLFGLTGGYIWSYIPVCVLISCVSHRFDSFGITLGICIVSLVICYFFGSVQYTLVANVSAKDAIIACVIPFAVFDVFKSLLASFVGIKIRKSIKIYYV